MRAVARNVEDEQRRAWQDYADRVRDLGGAEYEQAEAAAWEDLQVALRGLGVEAATAEDQSV
jgi:hypothetical protein